MKTEAPTEAQATVFKCLKRMTKALGFPPSVREMMREMKFKSPESVHKHLRALREKGLVEFKSRRFIAR